MHPFGQFWPLLWTAILWSAWCVVHSLLNEEHVLRHTPLGTMRTARYYRLFYCVFAVLTLWLAVTATPRIAGPAIWSWAGPWKAIQGLIIFLGAAVIVLSFRVFPLTDFLGLTALGIGNSRARRPTAVATYGVYALVRHPQFAGGILLLWSRNIDATAVVVNVVLTGYLLIGAWIEERRLLERFGHEYERYRSEVPRFFPRRLPSLRTLLRNAP